MLTGAGAVLADDVPIGGTSLTQCAEGLAASGETDLSRKNPNANTVVKSFMACMDNAREGGSAQSGAEYLGHAQAASAAANLAGDQADVFGSVAGLHAGKISQAQTQRAEEAFSKSLNGLNDSIGAFGR